MKIGTVDLDKQVLLIAEIGNNHEGDVELAEKLVHLAADAGADVVKFQTITPQRLVRSTDIKRLHQLERFALSRTDHEHLASVAENAGIMFMSTPFSIAAIQWLDELVPAFKIASGDNDFDPLLSRVAKTDKPIILSTGMSTEIEIERVCRVIRQTWETQELSPGLALLQCVSAYPAPVDQINLATIQSLQSRCDIAGYSDHTEGIEVAALAVAAGARIIEKHFTIDKHFSDFRDHQLSADPKELRMLADRIKEVFTIVGSKKKECQESEYTSSLAARRSIVARHDLHAGKMILAEDLDWLRPADGLSPQFSQELIGKRLKCDITIGQNIFMEMVD